MSMGILPDSPLGLAVDLAGRLGKERGRALLGSPESDEVVLAKIGGTWTVSERALIGAAYVRGYNAGVHEELDRRILR